MAEPFIFHFKPNSDGEPEAMYMTDLLALCSLCKHEQIQRFYHTTSLHRLDRENIVNLATTLDSKIELECENCGTDFQPADVIATTLSFSFADDTGTFVAFYRNEILRFEIYENKRLDPQTLPGFELPEHDAFEYLEEKLQRVINPKKLWLELFDSLAEDPKEGAWATAAPGYHFVIHHDEEEHLQFLASFAQDSDFEIALDNMPARLPLGNEEMLYAPIETWLTPLLLKELEKNAIFATAIVSSLGIAETIQRAFKTANLSYTYKNSLFTEIKTPTDVVFDGEIAIISVAERAVATGLTPGEAARLTAEEVVGTLLRIWR